MEFQFDLLYHNVLDLFNSGICKFLSTLYNYDDMPRRRVDEIVNGVHEIFQSEVIKVFVSRLIDKLKVLNYFYESIISIQNILNLITNPFLNLETEHKKLNFLTRFGSYFHLKRLKLVKEKNTKLKIMFQF